MGVQKFGDTIVLLLQLNGEDVSVVKVPKKKLDKLTKEDAIMIALQQDDLQDILRDKNVLNMTYVHRSEYDCILNIYVSQFKRKKDIKSS